MKYVPKMVQVHLVQSWHQYYCNITTLERGEVHHLHLERHLPPFAQGTLVRLAHPLNVREAAPVIRHHEAMVQHLDVRER